MNNACGSFLVLISFLAFGRQPATSLPTMPIDSGFGAYGTYGTIAESIPHPKWHGHNVYFFHPRDALSRIPLIFFCHGVGAENPVLYSQLIRHIVSWGYGVLYSTYSKPLAMASPVKAYAMIQGGFNAGIKKWSVLIDTTRIGYVGHSFGAGAIPALAWKTLSDRTWGRRGAFLFIMVPWYSYQITQDQLDHFPKNVKVIVETFDDDRVNDPRMAIDLYRNIGVPKDEKEFIRLDSDTSGDGASLVADHNVPQGIYAYGWDVNALDYYGVYRLVNALAVYAFDNDRSAKSIALGHGSAAQRFMGKWRNGRPVRELYAAGDQPELRYPQAVYMNFWTHAANPRSRNVLTFDTSAAKTTGVSTTISNYALLKAYQSQLKDEKEKAAKAKAESADKILKKQEKKNRDENVDKDRLDSLEDLARKAEDSASRLPILPIDSGFGAPGSYSVKEVFFPHPSGGSNYLYGFIPQNIPGPVPVVLFAPELQTTGKKYRELLRHLASRGCIVISSTYRYGLFISNARRYETLLEGFSAGIELFRLQIDTTRIGFAGHSYGAGALPAIAWHFLNKRDWGQKGAFLFLMSPSYVHCMSQDQFERFPPHVKLVIETYESDHWNDYRIAEDIFYSINIHPAEKDFLIVRELSHGRQKINAEYQTPYCEDAKDLTPMHYYAIFRQLDALADYTFKNDEGAKNVCLGNGSAEQVYMGKWWDGTATLPLVSTDMPITVNKLWPHGVTSTGFPAFFNWIWPFPYSCNFHDIRNERRNFPIP
jgi:hypothetical protein